MRPARRKETVLAVFTALIKRRTPMTTECPQYRQLTQTHCEGQAEKRPVAGEENRQRQPQECGKDSSSHLHLLTSAW